MTSEKIGKLFMKDTKTKMWWMKLGVALILSNVFFFILFSGDSDVKQEVSIPKGWVEIQLEAQLLTPFQNGKKVLIIHRLGRKKLEGVLLNEAQGPGRLTVLVKEEEAHALLQFETWEILPYLKHLNFSAVKKEMSHEIRY